ncbi:MAG: electron transfer flavoprotein subunit alpha/FixB family protein [Acidimicrobiia bacterium]|nr:electron transfer flavoprotein subunit alpha/FixB family protein [Acidimicrobiia bacterium]
MTEAVVVVTWRGVRGDPVPETEAALTLGRGVAASLGGELRWLVLGPAPEGMAVTAARHGAAAVDHVDDPKLGPGRFDALVEALARYAADRSPRLFLFPNTFDARPVAPRLAGRLGTAVVMNAIRVDAADGRLTALASANGGNTVMVYGITGPGPSVVTALTNIIVPEDAPEPSTPEVSEVAVDLSGVEERIRVVQEAHTEGPRIEDADVLVAGGRGLGVPENFKLVEELAEALGGLAAASRPLVDDGWIDSSRQVGITGRITRPALYVAAGISGAMQHMAGCAAAKAIVAVNTDPDASIFRFARYGVVGDCTEILPELTRAVKERGASR